MVPLRSIRISTSVPISLVLVSLVGLAVLLGCSSAPDDSDRTVVAVTILPQAGFVEAVGGDRVDVVIMVPPGASPHTYEVTPDQMMQLSRAAMYAKVGSPVEFELAWMDRLIAANRDMLVVDCAGGIDLIHYDDDHHHDDDHDHDHDHEHADDDYHHHEGADPHIWLSVHNAKIMVKHICEGLVQVDPSHEDHYRNRCADYLVELDGLDRELEEALEDLENRRFLAFHPSFGYFAQEYGLVQMSVEQGGNEPDAQYLVRLIEEAKEHTIQLILASPQFSTRSAEVIASEIDGQVVLVDPLARDYVSNMRSIATAIRQVT